MSHDELKTLLNERFGQMFQLITAGSDNIPQAQALLDELVTELLKEMK